MPEQERPDVSTGEVGMFLLEIVGLIGIGRWGWHLGTSTMLSLVLALVFIATASAVWTLFRTRGFVPSGRDPIIAIPGPVRVLIEYAFYIAGAWGLWVSGWQAAALIFVAGVAVVTIAMRDRLAGLLGNRPEAPRVSR